MPVLHISQNWVRVDEALKLLIFGNLFLTLFRNFIILLFVMGPVCNIIVEKFVCIAYICFRLYRRSIIHKLSYNLVREILV